LIVKGGTLDSAASTFAGPHSGEVDLTAAAKTLAVTYTGLTPVDMTGSTINNLVFNLPDGGSAASLELLGTLRLRATDNSFETTSSATPASSLTIHAGAGTDTVTVDASLPSTFTAALSVLKKSAADNLTITQNATLSLGSASSTGAVTFDAATIND